MVNVRDNDDNGVFTTVSTLYSMSVPKEPRKR